MFVSVRGVGLAYAEVYGIHAWAAGVSTQIVVAAGGRLLCYEEVGDPAGVPIVVIHGTPGCRLSGRHPDPARVTAAGLRLVSYDRPGYGQSTRHPGRDVVDCVADVAAIAEHLGLDRFAVTGGSGGGPHALAVAARLPDRVTRVSCFVGAAPFDAEGLDWFAGMDPSNVREFGWAQDGERTLARELQREARQVLETVQDDPTSLLGGIELSESDRAVIDDPGFRETLGVAIREMLAQGVWGWVDDDLAFIKPWGFDVAELRVPADIRYGATDVLVPATHGEWLAAHVPGARVLIDAHGGHLHTPEERLGMLQTLAAP